MSNYKKLISCIRDGSYKDLDLSCFSLDNDKNIPLLFKIIKKRKNRLLRLVIKDGVLSPYIQESTSGKNILHIAAQLKNDYPFKLGIDFSKLNEKDYDGNYPIHVAAKEGNLSFLKNLVRVGFNVNQISEYGNTALSWAVLNKDKKMMAYLISKGADVDTFIGGVYLKMTALMWLARNNEFELAKFLISKGANMNAKNKNGDTVLDYALFGEDLTTACFLNSIGATSTKISPLQIKKLADGLCLYEKNILFKTIKDPEKEKDLHKV